MQWHFDDSEPDLELKPSDLATWDELDDLLVQNRNLQARNCVLESTVIEQSNKIARLEVDLQEITQDSAYNLQGWRAEETLRLAKEAELRGENHELATLLGEANFNLGKQSRLLAAMRALLPKELRNLEAAELLEAARGAK